MSDRTETDAGPPRPADAPHTATYHGGLDHTSGPPIPSPPSTTAPGWEPGQVVGDYSLLEVLGRGAFGTVFLARQESLDRRVALKVSTGGRAARGEALTLAGLEHDHIVKVFAEFTESNSGRHCLCLQYVPGTNLSDVIKELYANGKQPQSGRELLSSVDLRTRGESRFDPGALRDRVGLGSDTFPQAVCRLGERLARALAFAHSRNVLHCDIKPANILLTPYGRPLLADFNVSFDRERRDPADHRVGGTLRYMAPEHRAALYGDPNATVDERSDIYSLGVVLYELATGTVPESDAVLDHDDVPRELLYVLRRTLDPDPTRRYATATDLADALAAAWRLFDAQRSLPPPGRVGRILIRHPFLSITALALIPHLVATVLNIGYNSVQIHLNAAQEEAFRVVIVWYNFVIYSAVFVMGWRILRGLHARFHVRDTLDGVALDALRRRVLTLGYWAIGLAVAGWIPGGIIFPIWVDAMAGGLRWTEYVHFLISFTLSGLVGVVFSYLGVTAVVLRVLYPALGNPDRFSPEVADQELRPVTRLFAWCVVLASALPLTGAVLILVLADWMLDDGRITLGFRVLVVGLIGLGMLGVSLASQITERLSRLAVVWTQHGNGGRIESSRSEN